MIEVAIVMGAYAPPLRVQGYLCEDCPGRAIFYPRKAYLAHRRTHQGEPAGRKCKGPCGRTLPLDQFAVNEWYMSGRCFDCMAKQVKGRGRPKGIQAKEPVGIRAKAVWGPGMDEGGDA